MDDKEIRVRFIEKDDDNIPYGAMGTVTKVRNKGCCSYAVDVEWDCESLEPSTVFLNDVKVIG